MSTVEAKMIYSEKEKGDISVWEITTSTGSKIYYEREYKRGYRPIGLAQSYKLGSSTINVCELVKGRRNRKIQILRAKDGYVAPMHWYEKDPLYDGPASAVVHFEESELEPVVDDGFSSSSEEFYD
jgi:hypothetical protein